MLYYETHTRIKWVFFADFLESRMAQQMPEEIEKFLKMLDDGDPSVKVKDLRGRVWDLDRTFQNVTWEEGVLQCKLFGATSFVLTVTDEEITAEQPSIGAKDVFTIINPS